MNIGIILLIVLLILLIIGAIVASVIAYNNFQSNSGGGGGGQIKIPCNQSVDISSLVQLPSSLTPCYQAGRITNLYYIGQISNYDFVVAPYGSSPIDVCVGYCTKYSDGTCTGNDYNGKTAQQNFDNCMKQITPTNCLPPIPVAALGPILYYPLQPTASSCCPSSNPDC